MIGNSVPFNLPSALAKAAPLQPIQISEKQIQQVVDFVLRRLEQVLVDSGTSVEAVRAVLRQRGHSPALAAESAQQLQASLHHKQTLNRICTSSCSRPSRTFIYTHAHTVLFKNVHIVVMDAEEKQVDEGPCLGVVYVFSGRTCCITQIPTKFEIIDMLYHQQHDSHLFLYSFKNNTARLWHVRCT